MPSSKEHKFRVSESVAEQVREFIEAYCEPDASLGGAGISVYPVTCLYFDSGDLLTLRDAVDGAKRRYKLRVRTYDDAPDAPVHLEVKHRRKRKVVKQCGVVHRASYDEIILGREPVAGDIHGEGGEAELEAIRTFMELMREIEARPRARVRYLREAWVATDDPRMRVTFDRDVSIVPHLSPRLEGGPMENAARPFGEQVILEVKFSGKAPYWYRDLRGIGTLKRSSAPKYCAGVLARGQDEFNPIDEAGLSVAHRLVGS